MFLIYRREKERWEGQSQGRRKEGLKERREGGRKLEGGRKTWRSQQAGLEGKEIEGRQGIKKKLLNVFSEGVDEKLQRE